MHPKNKKRPGLASAASLLSSYRLKAKDRGLEFKLTFEQFLEVTAGNCYLCGAPPGQTVKAQQRNGAYVYNGIDRVDNAKGYVLDNVMACCKTCNRIKSQLSLEELGSHVQKIVTESSASWIGPKTLWRLIRAFSPRN